LRSCSAHGGGNLFGVDLGPASGSKDSSAKAESALRKPRVVRADRHQLRLESRSLDQLIPHDHRARTLWLASERLDLSAFYAEIEAVESGPGRPAIDPRVLLVLWLYAISEGVGSARRLSRLCQEHDAYRWITGGLDICHRVLSDFRVRHGDKLDQLLTELLAALMKAGAVTLRTVAQDGTRVRASAGAASFRREKSLKKCLREAKQQVRALKTRLDDDDETTDKRKRAARERAAREREEAVTRALEALKEVEESRRRNGKKGEPRASTTDPDARVMKMADGGFRRAYNYAPARRFAPCGSPLARNGRGLASHHRDPRFELRRRHGPGGADARGDSQAARRQARGLPRGRWLRQAQDHRSPDRRTDHDLRTAAAQPEDQGPE